MICIIVIIIVIAIPTLVSTVTEDAVPAETIVRIQLLIVIID